MTSNGGWAVAPIQLLLHFSQTGVHRFHGLEPLRPGPTPGAMVTRLVTTSATWEGHDFLATKNVPFSYPIHLMSTGDLTMWKQAGGTWWDNLTTTQATNQPTSPFDRSCSF